MYKFYIFIVNIFLILCLTGCSNTKYAVEPGYYQEARFNPVRVEPGYYDVLGNYHPEKIKAAYYQPGRWHRAYVGESSKYKVPGGHETGGIVGTVSSQEIAEIAADTDLANIIQGAVSSSQGIYNEVPYRHKMYD